MRLVGRIRNAVLLVALSPAFSLGQSTWYVDVDGVPPGTGTVGDPYTSIQYGLDQPSTGEDDLFLVAPGEYIENLDLAVAGLTLRSTDGPAQTIVRATDGGTLLVTQLDAVVEGFTLGGAAGEPTSARGVHVDFGATVVLRRCVVRGCDTGVFNEYDAIIEHSTISNNDTGVNVTGLGALFMWNSIVWGNGIDMRCSGFVTAYVDHSAGFASGICEHTGGTGNILGDPLMWRAEDDDYFLKPDSPCIGAGTPAGADIGAFEYDSSYAPEPEVYCTAKPNSLGCLPAIGYSGQPSATSPTPFLLRADDVVPAKLGFVLYSREQWAIPFQGGFHCVRPPTKRTTPVISGGAGGQPCPGTFEIDFNARIQGGADPGLLPGAFVYAQYWHRDLQEPAGFGSGLTDALCFGIAP